MNIVTKFSSLIGNTPLYALERIGAAHGLAARLLAKLEFLNPFGSAKDRSMLGILEDGEARGLITKDTVIVEPTSGNAGISLAYLCAQRGIRLVVTMPDSMSLERRAILKALGAEIVLTPAAGGMNAAIEKARALVAELPNAFLPMQFQNPANPEAHRRTTGEELWRDTDGKLDILVAGFGSGGTISGAGAALKAHNPSIRVIGVEPAGSPIVSEGRAGAHKIQGIGAGFVPDNLDTALLDEILTISDEDAFAFTRELARTEGLLCGISSGAALAAAVAVAKRPENSGRLIAVILPDTGERYLSMELF